MRGPGAQPYLPAETAGIAGKIAVVTGVTSGIGKALAGRLIAEGAHVVGLGRSAEALSAVLAEWGKGFTGVRTELASRLERRETLNLLRRRLPRVDIIVNNAAECVYDMPLTLDGDRFARLLEINTLAAIELIQALAGALPSHGQIINVSSVTARHIAHPRFAPYAVTKVALERFTEGLRLELAPRGIRVSLIAPGLVDTPLYDKVAGFEAAREALDRQVPEWLSASDVADAVVWMLTRPPSVTVSELVLLPRFQAR
jgi:NAD(P)-dependent dehydrogenase (short-subunit alcohol dehydrogenase family)